MDPLDYWKECISAGAQDCGLTLTKEQLHCLAEVVQGSHENYGMAYYEPPSSDRIQDIEREHQQKYKQLEKQFDTYRGNAETAVKQALHQHSKDSVSIGAHGEVFRHGGRTTQIQ